METDARASFPSLLKAQRLARGLSQEGLAERAGLSREAISLLERGMRLSPRRDTVTLLAKTLQLSVDERARLLAAASEHHGRTASATSRVAGSPASLPVRLVRFIGREQEIAEVQDLLLAKRLVTLTGPGGIGKTSLALAVAAVQEQFVDGVALVELAALTDEEWVPQAVAAVLGVREQEGEPILTTLGLALGTTQRLLVLDNCEHLLTSCARVAEALLRACPRLRILATSREPLRVGAEVIWRVPALALPEEENQPLAELAKSEAVCLFVERAGAVRPGFALSAGNAAAVAEICRRLDGIPLAIELAAARVGSLPPKQIARLLSDRFRLLTTGSRTALPRHRTLRALIDWSYDLLSDSEQILFRRLAVFAGGWTLEAAEAVCEDVSARRRTPPDTQNLTPSTSGDVLDQLIGLVDKSVVLVEDRGGEARFTMLETIREYALEQLAGSGQLPALRHRHAAWYLSLAEESQPFLLGQHHVRLVTRLEQEHDNLRAALRWLRESGDVVRALRLGGALQMFWFTEDYNAEGRRELDALLELPGASNHCAALASVRQGAGIMALNLGDLPAARSHLEWAIDYWRGAGNRRQLATSVVFLGCVAGDQGDCDQAVRCFEEGLGLSREVGDRGWEGYSLLHLGRMAREQGDPRRARALLEESLAIYRDPAHNDGFMPVAANVVHQLGLVAEDLGDDSVARTLYRESLTAFTRFADRAGIAAVLETFAILAAKAGRPVRALRLLGAAARLHEEISSPVAMTMQGRYARTLGLARGQLSTEAAATALAEGRKMTWPEATAYALRDDEVTAADDASGAEWQERGRKPANWTSPS